MRRIACLAIVLAACDPRDVVEVLATRAAAWLSPAAAPASSCSRAKLTADATSAFQTGLYGVAATRFEQAMRCGSQRDDKLARMLVVASCYAKDEARAKRYFNDLAPADKPTVSTLCQNLMHPCTFATQGTERDVP